MQPVRKLLGPTRHVFISPDGALNLIPFAALVDERGQYLVKQYLFTQLTSGRDLLRLQEHIPSKQKGLVIADPDFGELARTDPSKTVRETEPSANGVFEDLYFAPLKAAADEARELKAILPDTETLTRDKATESALKDVSGPKILHIATHGFFLDELAQVQQGDDKGQTRILKVKRVSTTRFDENDPARLVNPLLRSGLGFAGANVRAGKDGDDGILTALEASGLDLWGTKLVVLSACDTGVGEVKAGDGVYGLRRALVLAGSESQVMSLWPVSDRGTRELMTGYYRGLIAGQGRSEALRRVQLRMLRDPKRRHPFYWASFIQSGEWANLEGKR
jgi:CHAT domain-containing protein